MKQRLMEASFGGVMLADGAIGTELQRRGLAPGICAEGWNTERPEEVAAVHRAYVDAGARLRALSPEWSLTATDSDRAWRTRTMTSIIRFLRQ